MNTNTPRTEAPDELDRLFSDFFKAQLKQPWPKAPTPGAATAVPSELAAPRANESPRNQPAARRDSTARARLTLAASVALAVGACWFLADGTGANPRGGTAAPGGMPGLLNSGSADGSKSPIFNTIEKNKATAPANNGGIVPKIEPGEIE